MQQHLDSECDCIVTGQSGMAACEWGGGETAASLEPSLLKQLPVHTRPTHVGPPHSQLEQFSKEPMASQDCCTPARLDYSTSSRCVW